VVSVEPNKSVHFPVSKRSLTNCAVHTTKFTLYGYTSFPRVQEIGEIEAKIGLPTFFSAQ
jgi:hypothetical protein